MKTKIILISIILLTIPLAVISRYSRRQLAVTQAAAQTNSTALASVTKCTKTAATRAETRENITTTASTAKHTAATTKAAETAITAQSTANDSVYVTVIATGYCPCSECSEGYGRQTASGATATAGRTIAVDPLVFPYGTKLLIDGVVYVAEDRGGAITGNRIDIFFDTHAEAEAFGRRELKAMIMS